MHKEILTEEQVELLPLIRQFNKEYYLAEGTAVALYIGHRRSGDFDLFKNSPINHKKNLKKIEEFGKSYEITRRTSEQMSISVGDVRLKFFEYPFRIQERTKFEDIIRLPELIDLAAMKAYTLGRRSKWKDYVDFYFIIKDYYSIEQISERAFRIYNQLFSEKLFRAQLNYFDDIDYSEQVEYVVTAVSEDEIRAFLTEKSTDLQL